MKYFFFHGIFAFPLMVLTSFCFFVGCDSGEKAIDELTGKRAVKQYQKSKKDIEKIAEKQEERYNNFPDDEGKK